MEIERSSMTNFTKRIVIASFSALVAVGYAAAQGRGDFPPGQNPGRGEQQATADNAQRPKMPPPEEKSSVTHHTVSIGGQQIAYTATAGTYVLKADDGTPKASMFFVAYTKDGVDDITKRPVAFSYNGGPGSASCFVHMGFGPKRTVVTADGHGMPAPYEFVDNDQS